MVEFRRHSYRWSALVLRTRTDDEDRPVSVQTWFPVERLIPVRSDPNNGGRVRTIG